MGSNNKPRAEGRALLCVRGADNRRPTISGRKVGEGGTRGRGGGVEGLAWDWRRGRRRRASEEMEKEIRRGRAAGRKQGRKRRSRDGRAQEGRVEKL